MLTVVGRTIINNRTYWKCKCDCGGERITRTHNLKIGITKTCGCKLKRPLYKNNTSGHRGVGYLKNNKKYHARIKYQGKDIHLGCFDDIEEAIKARQLAEEKYFGKILDEKE